MASVGARSARTQSNNLRKNACLAQLGIEPDHEVRRHRNIRGVELRSMRQLAISRHSVSSIAEGRARRWLLRFFPRAGTTMHVIGWRMTQRARGRTVSTMAGTGGCGLISKAHLLPRASKVNTYLCSLRPESRWFTSESPTRRWRHPWWHALVTSCESCGNRRESELVSQLKCFDEM